MSEEIDLDKLSNEKILAKIQELTVYGAYLVHKTTGNLNIDYSLEFEPGIEKSFNLRVTQND